MTAPCLLRTPTTTPVALVLDSPHSSAHLPPDFDHAVGEAALRDAEDLYVDELYDEAPAFGAVLLEAGFARTYVDANRHAGDIDLELVEGDWPHDYAPSGKAGIGKAVIWRTLDDGRPIYARRLSVDEVRHRIEHYLLPYQRTLAQLIGATRARHGVSYHVNCHSMASVSGRMGEGGAGRVRADVVLGDRDGTTCAPEFTALVRDTMTSFGYDVRVNDPFKGVELVRAWSDPRAGRHSLQVELNKRLYMDEKTLQRSAGFDALKRDLTRLLAVLADFAKDRSR